MVGDSSLVNVKNVGESHKIRQTDSGLGVDAQEGPGEFPRGLILPLPIRPLPHDFATGVIPHAGFWHTNKQIETDSDI